MTRYQDRISKGLCGSCGVSPNDGNSTLCSKCRSRQRKNSQDYQSRRFFHARARVIKLKDSTSTVTAKDLWSMWHKQRGICPLLGVKLDKQTAHVDHIVSPLRGGKTVPNNIRWTHKTANVIKQQMSDEQLLKICKTIVFNLSKLKS
jgi:hypothetical protein